MNNKSGSDEQLKYERLFESMIHEGLGESGSAVTILSRRITEHFLAELSHLQKLVEEQKGEIERLKEIEEAYYNEVFDENGERRASKLESQITTQTAEIERLKKERNDLEKLVSGLDVDNPSAVDTLIDAMRIQKENYQVTIERLKKHDDSDIVNGVLRMENKKIGGVLADICKLLKESGVEKRYYDQADMEAQLANKTERVNKMRDVLKKIAPLVHQGHSYKAAELSEQALNQESLGDGK